MRMTRISRREDGLTILELIIAIGLIATLISISLVFVATNQREVILNEDRAFAVQKAAGILAELRGVAENPATVDASTLDAYDDGAGTSFILAADRTIVDPAHEASGNVWTATRWKFARRITVRKFTSLESRDVRIVTVRVFLTDPSGVNDAVVLADVASVINTIADAYPPSQVVDTYLLAIENVPGWWVYMSYIRPFIETALDDLQARQPGLVFRRHWITKSGFGRDQLYQPYFNEAVDSNAAIPGVYFYPGLMPAGSAVDQYYVPGQMTSRINVDGATRNDYDAATNPFPYTMADQYNHAMRQPREQAIFNARVTAGNDSADTPTYRLLLDDMIRNPDRYRNAIFINLHGELVPFPPLRNYSDAAGEGIGRPFARVVTHPQKLRSPQVENVLLRVYSYYEDEARNAALPPYLNVPVTVFLPMINLTTPGDITITSIRGGTDQEPANAAADTYLARTPAFTNLSAIDPTSPNRMWTRVTFVGGASPGTLIELHNSPMRCPAVGGAGLDATSRLYGNDYIPCTVEAANDFSKNLTNTTATPKNTARWIINISRAALDREYGAGNDVLMSVQTRIGLDLGTGAIWPVTNQPTNLSTTYVWRSNDPEFVPFSERFQYQGDPRHLPYLDVKAAHGYNWYFDNFREGATNRIANWPGFDAARIRNSNGDNFDGWHGSGTNGTGADSCEIDVPRCFQFLRTALTRSNSIYTTLTGFSYYYMGIGNEIGYDAANGFANSIPVNRRPFDGGAGSRFEDSITTINTGGVKLIREFTSPYWWAKPWLGELYPDRDSTGLVPVAATWQATGNLPTPIGGAAQPGTFVRIRRQDIRLAGAAPLARANSLPSGTRFDDYRTVHRLNSRGCVSFFNSGTTASTFRHQGRDGTSGNVAAGGTQLDATYNFPVPTNTLISRPFRLDYNLGAGGVGDEFALAEYAGANKCTIANLLTYYDHQDGTPPWLGSAMVRLAEPGGQNAFIAVNGIDRTVETGSAFIATFSSLTLIHTFLSAGLPGTPSRVMQLPQLVIDSPNDATELRNPAVIQVMWGTHWARWDGKPYTPGYLNDPGRPDPLFGDPRYTVAEIPETDVNLRYALLYSADNGQSWQHMIDNSPATPGSPTAALLRADLNPGAGEWYDWDVVGGSPLVEASYLIRVEAYREFGPNQFSPHYAFHQQKIFVDR